MHDLNKLNSKDLRIRYIGLIGRAKANLITKKSEVISRDRSFSRKKYINSAMHFVKFQHGKFYGKLSKKDKLSCSKYSIYSLLVVMLSRLNTADRHRTRPVSLAHTVYWKRNLFSH